MDFEELARRAVACKGWRWLPGMANVNGGRILAADYEPDGGWSVDIHRGDVVWTLCDLNYSKADIGVPDLTDPGTFGCLLALVREAWSYPTACVVHEGSDHPDPWAVRARRGEALGIGVTEAEALVLALEAAP